MPLRIHSTAVALFAVMGTHAVAHTTSTAADETPRAPELQKVIITGTKPTTYAPPSSVSAGKSDMSLLEMPLAVQVVPRELLIDQRAFTLKDAVCVFQPIVDGISG